MLTCGKEKKNAWYWSIITVPIDHENYTVADQVIFQSLGLEKLKQTLKWKTFESFLLELEKKASLLNLLAVEAIALVTLKVAAKKKERK